MAQAVEGGLGHTGFPGEFLKLAGQLLRANEVSGRLARNEVVVLLEPFHFWFRFTFVPLRLIEDQYKGSGPLCERPT